MKRVLKFIDNRFEEIIGVVILAAVVTIIFLGVVLRVLFKSGIAWQEEISRSFYVILVYLGASYGMITRDHIRVTVIWNVLSEQARRVLRVVTDLIWLGFNIAVIIVSLDLYHQMRRFLGESPVLKIPLNWIFLTVPLGFALLSLRLVEKYLRLLFAGEQESAGQEGTEK